MKCQIPMCNKEATKEVRIAKMLTHEIKYFFCEKHFKAEERYYRKIKQPREIFDLTPKVDDRVKVQFT